MVLTTDSTVVLLSLGIVNFSIGVLIGASLVDASVTEAALGASLGILVSGVFSLHFCH